MPSPGSCGAAAWSLEKWRKCCWLLRRLIRKDFRNPLKRLKRSLRMLDAEAGDHFCCSCSAGSSRSSSGSLLRAARSALVQHPQARVWSWNAVNAPMRSQQDTKRRTAKKFHARCYDAWEKIGCPHTWRQVWLWQWIRCLPLPPGRQQT